MNSEDVKQTMRRVIASGPFAATWESLTSYQAPAWYADGKFGIFIHWSPYSVPAFDNEWYPRNMYLKDSVAYHHHVETYGPQTTFGYRDFLPLFKAEHFDPEVWAALFKQAGAKYVVPVAEHLDGFAMYDCSFTRWNVVNLGPQRDVLDELAAATRRQGLTFGLSYHRAEHWWFLNGGRDIPSDVQDPRSADFYGPAQTDPDTNPPDAAFLDDWLVRLGELVEQYQPQLVYLDWWIEQPVFQSYLSRFAAYYYNWAAQWNQRVVVNYKQVDFKDRHAFAEGSAVYDIERGRLNEILPHVWQSDTSILRNSWCHVASPDYKSVPELIAELVDVVSKNGTLLLNIGPRADGVIPELAAEMLRAIGRWLAVNGEAIYGSRPWKVFDEGPTVLANGSFTDAKKLEFTSQDIRFTTRGEALYATFIAWPECGAVVITSLAEQARLYPTAITRVELLGSDTPLTWARDAAGLRVELPVEKPSQCAGVLKITA